jgi:Fe2+ transport system protein FeoA
MVNIRTEYSTSLADLPARGSARVLGLADSFAPYERQRLTDLGMVPGTQISVRKASALGGLRAYSLRGTVVGLRHEQARQIHVEVEE